MYWGGCMDIRSLITLKTILQEGSYNKAAHKLGYTQSTVTFQIQQLEQQLSIKLFDKIGRRMILSQAGKDILPYIDSIIQSVEQIQNYGKSDKELTGELKVALPESLLTYKMQPVIKAFRSHAPEVKLTLRSLNCYLIKEQILTGEADIAIHYDVGGYNSTMITEPIGDFSLTLMGSPSLECSEMDFMSANQSKEVSLLIDDPNSVYKSILDEYLKRKNISLDSKIELWSIESTKRSAASNLGVVFLPTFTIQDEINNGSLIELDTELSNQKITAICVYHKNKWISPAMKLFISLVKQNFADS